LNENKLYGKHLLFLPTMNQSASPKSRHQTKNGGGDNEKPSYSIAFLGIDGSGKTTIINRVTPLLKEVYSDRVYYEHLRPNCIPTLARLLGKKRALDETDTNPHVKKQSGPLGSIFRFGYYFLDYTLGYYLKIFPKKAFHSCVWIFDRYYYEYLIDPLRTRISLPKWVFKAGMLLIPEPDLIICLGTIPKIIHSRKPEMNVEEITRQMYELSNFCKGHKNAVWVDTSCRIEHSVYKTLQVIYEKMGTPFDLKKYDGSLMLE
jgi:thymidylate kinase